MKICISCKKCFPNRIEIDNKIRSLSKRKYCLDCSPFGQHRTRSPEYYKSSKTEKFCPKCQTIKKSSCFYMRRNNRHFCSYCIDCTAKQCHERTYKTKIQCVEYKGGSCRSCGYKKCLDALEFHHKDPKSKKFNINQSRKMHFEDMKEELDKCVLLCSLCHREVEAGVRICPD